jgi:asparagine synthase (glutamine-hydrolysing)
MSGIAGYVGLEAGVVDEAVLRRMARQLEHRGPDGEGLAMHGRVGLVHRRLAVIDRASGVQPLRSVDGRHLIVYDGEVYNYRELREELIALGHAFSSRGDAEVVTAAWTQWGVSAFDRFNGVFAVAILDTATGEVTLVRDQFGGAPLYLGSDGSGRVAFASEIRAVIAAGVVPRRPDDRTVHRYLTLGIHDDTEHTFFDRVTRVLPGQLVVISPAGQVRRKTYTRLFHDLDWLATARRPYASAARAQLATETDAAIQRRLVSDLPVGAGLGTAVTGSAAVAGCAYRLDVHKVRLDPARLADDLPDFVRTQQEPVAALAAYTDYCAIREARAQVTVLLSGAATGDRPGIERPGPPLALADRIRRRRRPTGVAGLLAADFAAAYPAGDEPGASAEELFRCRLAAQLRYEDRNALRFSVQRRLPLLDPYLLRLQWSLDRRTAAPPRLPAVEPRALAELACEVLDSPSFNARPYADRAAVVSSYQSYLDGRPVADPALFWRLLNLELWLREFVDRDPSAPPASTFVHHYPKAAPAASERSSEASDAVGISASERSSEASDAVGISASERSSAEEPLRLASVAEGSDAVGITAAPVSPAPAASTGLASAGQGTNPG